jgi:hypothetical protein
VPPRFPLGDRIRFLSPHSKQVRAPPAGGLRLSLRTADAALARNARVEMPPGELEHIVRDTLARTAGQRVRIDIRRLQSLRPGRPQPTYRYNRVAG